MGKTLCWILPLINLTENLSACPLCRAQVAAVIYSQAFGINLLIVLLPIPVLAALAVGIYRAVELMGLAGKGR